MRIRNVNTRYTKLANVQMNRVQKSRDRPTLHSGRATRMYYVMIGCSSLRGGGGELGTNKNLDLWLQLVCTKLKLKHAM